MRFLLCLVIALTLAGVSLEGQAGPRGGATAAAAPAKPDAHAAPAKPAVAPPAVQVAPVKPDAHAAAPKAAAPQTPSAQAAPAPERKRSLEEAAEAIAAALAARGLKSAQQRPLALTGAPAPPRPLRLKRYSLYWPEEDIHWDVRWPIITGRVAITWDEETVADEPGDDGPASD